MKPSFEKAQIQQRANVESQPESQLSDTNGINAVTGNRPSELVQEASLISQ